MELSRGKLVIFRQHRLTLLKRFALSPTMPPLILGALQPTARQEVRPLESSTFPSAAENLEQPNVEC
jgi:hypothetical protein